MQKTIPGFPENERRDHYQRERIHERRQDSCAMVAEGLYSIGGLELEPKRNRGQHQRQGIGEIVSGIRQQRQAASPKARNHLDHDKAWTQACAGSVDLQHDRNVTKDLWQVNFAGKACRHSD